MNRTTHANSDPAGTARLAGRRLIRWLDSSNPVRVFWAVLGIATALAAALACAVIFTVAGTLDSAHMIAAASGAAVAGAFVLGLFLFYNAALKNTASELREKRQRIEAILNALPAGVIAFDNDEGTITMANRKAARLLAMPRSEIIGSPFRRFFPAEEGPGPSGAAAADRQQRPTRHLQRSDGKLLPIYSSSIPARIGNRRHRVQIFFDPDEYRSTVADRIESERLQGAFELAGAVCHELNQPVQSIAGFSELLLMDLGQEHPHYKEVETINAQSLRMGRILKQLQGLTRYATKAYTRDSKIFDIEASTAVENSPEPSAADGTAADSP